MIISSLFEYFKYFKFVTDEFLQDIAGQANI